MSFDEILFEHRGAIGLITLNRPKALNALTHDMCLRMKKRLDEWKGDSSIKVVVVQGSGDRAFCAGGDIRSLYDSGKAGTPYALDFYRDEYLLDAAIKHYPKPYIALISGIVMGGGVGVSVHGSHRIADETTTFAMPETGIGLFPDVGGSYFLPRCYDGPEMGLYLALTGTRLASANVYWERIATNFVERKNRQALLDRLAGGEDPDTAIATLATPMPDNFVPDHREEIERIFAAHSVEALMTALDSEGTDWARSTAATIRKKSPTSIKLTFRQLKEGTKLSFDDCMRMEFRMVSRVVAGHDFYEGVRATIIDKDGAPKWEPDDLSAVSDASIDSYFAPLEERELKL
jgi:enoyl-CoA hydratase